MIDLSLQEVQKLESEFKCPLYIFDEAAFIDDYYEFEATLRKYYPRYHISYSYKTNYTPYVCALVKRLGGYAEIVSGMEYAIAKKVGYINDRIIFNGPNKGEDGIAALLEGCLVNVDSIAELNAVCKIANIFPDRAFQIGLRVNVDVGQNFVSRFGMDEEDIERAFRSVESIPNLNIAGFHCHISRCRGIDAWRRRTEVILGLSDQFFFDKHHGVILTADNKKQYLIPRGFAHGFLVLSDEAEFCYKCDDFYHADDEGGLAWNDPDVGIVWPEVTGQYCGSAEVGDYHLSDGSPLILSAKDQKWKGIKDTFKGF